MKKTSRGWNADIAASYDRAAEQYAETFFRELERKPFDRMLLDEYAGSVAGQGRVCDLGCGPGHVAGYLHARGVDVFGIDLSAAMVAVAKRLDPSIEFQQGDMLRLSCPGGSLAGIVAFYSVIHVERDSALRALKEMHRVLHPGAPLLLSFHAGEGELHREEFLGLPVRFHATWFQPDEMAGYLTAAGFQIAKLLTREPYDFEFQSTRVYILAIKGSDGVTDKPRPGR